VASGEGKYNITWSLHVAELQIQLTELYFAKIKGDGTEFRLA